MLLVVQRTTLLHKSSLDLIICCMFYDCLWSLSICILLVSYCFKMLLLKCILVVTNRFSIINTEVDRIDRLLIGCIIVVVVCSWQFYIYLQYCFITFILDYSASLCFIKYATRNVHKGQVPLDLFKDLTKLCVPQLRPLVSIVLSLSLGLLGLPNRLYSKSLILYSDFVFCTVDHTKGG